VTIENHSDVVGETVPIESGEQFALV
jgi:hypothetical protein